MKSLRPFLVAMLSLMLLLPAELRAEEQTWKVNLQDADIAAFIGQVADITGKSFIIDPRVKGKVTVLSSQAMTGQEIYELFLSVLRVHGYAATETDDGAIKIIPTAVSKQDGRGGEGRIKLRGDRLITRVIPLKSASVTELVPVLRPLVPQYGHLAGVQSANALIISDHAANIRRLLDIVERLDGEDSEAIEVIPLRHAWVGDLAVLLEELVPQQTGRSNKGQAGRFAIVADERSNRLILKGSKADRDRIKTLVDKLDQPVSSKGITQVLQLNHSDAKEMAELLQNLMGEEKTAEQQNGTTLKIQADVSLNALVVRAEPAIMSEVKNIVAQLDVRRPQVLIEAVIVELTGSATDQLGIQWLVGDLSGNSVVGGTSFNNAGVSAVDIVGATQTGIIPGGINGLLAGAGKFDGSSLDYGAILQALSATSNANLLSTPSIMTLDNQEAEIVVGQNVPFITGSFTTNTDTSSNPFTTISREDVGITLNVTPQINEDGQVRLEVSQEVSSLVPESQVSGSSDLITNKRSLKTTILADDQQTIVLGGLIQDDVTESVNKVPLLGDIPLLGALFRSTSTNAIKRNLLVFLRPSIMRDSLSVGELTQEKYTGIYRVQTEQRGKIEYLKERSAPLLPESMGDMFEAVPSVTQPE